MKFPCFKKEQECQIAGYDCVIGCDEVGVAPLAGPVVAAACVLSPNLIGKYRSKNKWYYRVRDSKTTNEKERQILLKKILENTVAFGIGEVSQEDIDKINIHKASLLAMRLAVEELLRKLPNVDRKAIVLIDGRCKIPQLSVDQKCFVKGDRDILSISAASIIAKVHRDNLMHEIDKKYPGYGFCNHKGYPTKEHVNAIKKLGMISLHRKSFFKKTNLSQFLKLKED